MSKKELTRTHDTGANRNSSDGKYEYYKFINPLNEFSFARYMYGGMYMPDGSRRDPDNWQKGLKMDWLMDSLVRHIKEIELIHAGYTLYQVKNEDGEHTLIEGIDIIPEDAVKVDPEKVLNAIRFNSEAYKLQYCFGYRKSNG